MNGARQSWLVALREMRERSRSRAFRVSLLVMVIVVAGAIAVPALLEPTNTKDVGFTGSTANGLAAAVRAQSRAFGKTARIHHFDTVAAGQRAVRDGDVDVLVVDGRRLEWPRSSDDELRAVVTGAIQVVAIRDRAASAGISSENLGALLAPVPVTNVDLGAVPGRSPDDQAVAALIGVVLLIAISTYGGLVLTGVVEEKANRVVEVLLARMPARSLLAGKVTGIGLLGLAQVALTAVVALAAIAIAGSLDLPAARGPVLVWAVVWFVLGYGLYAMVYGALGSLASRTEDAQSAAGPVITVLLVAYWASFLAVGQPDSGWAKFASFFPPTAPFAMPNRIAMGVTGWWEPVLAALLTVGTIGGLVQFGSRVYTGAVLQSGPRLTLRDAWRRGTPSHALAATSATSIHASRQPVAAAAGSGPVNTGGSTHRPTRGILIGLALALAAAIAVAVLTGDVIIGIAVFAGTYAVATRLLGSTSQSGRHSRHT